jgi:hypothetical protein
MDQNPGRFQPMTKLAAATAVLFLSLAGSALASPVKQYGPLKHPKRGHCRTHYWKRVQTHRIHGKRVKGTYCVYVAPKPTTSVLPSKTVALPTAPTAPLAVHLHAHLDPSFVQSPTDPLAVTYSFSASATEERVGFAQATQSLPSGVLNLYSDGLLECSVNVGGSAMGGECPVTYASTGAHTVITTYTSGTLSTAETYTEQVEPYATTTTAAASVESQSGNPAEEPRLWTVTASVTDQNANAVSGEVRYALVDTTTGAESRGALPTGTSCQIEENINPFRKEHERSFRGCGASLTVANADRVVLMVSFLGAPGYLPSSASTLGI